MSYGDPSRPAPDVKWEGITFLSIEPVKSIRFKVYILHYSMKQKDTKI